MKYLRESFTKFKKDALSKAFYDSIKYLIFSVLLVIVLKYIPVVKEWLKIEFNLTIWSILLISLLLIIASFSLSIYLFNKKLKAIESENQIDELTGLKNHKALELELVRIEKERNTKEEPISLILIDVDNFKKFNEENSYEVADTILSKLGNLLNKDGRITDETFRYFMRGDEFLIIAKETTISNAQLASERKRKLIEDSTFKVDNNSFNLTVSCGVTEFNIGETREVVIERLNQALQKAKKKTGKNNTEIII